MSKYDFCHVFFAILMLFPTALETNLLGGWGEMGGGGGDCKLFVALNSEMSKMKINLISCFVRVNKAK